MIGPGPLLPFLVLAGACAAGSGSPTAPIASPPVSETAEHRAFAPEIDGEPVLAGVAYGPYREGQRPGGPAPSTAQIREDLRLIAPRWHLIRMYGSRGPAEDVLRIVREEDLPIRVVLGAWIGADSEEDNAAEVREAIRLATTYEPEVVAVSVGNETQVSWSAHRLPAQTLSAHLRTVRAAVPQPVTTADDFSWWNQPESRAIAGEVDFLLVHAHPSWNGRSLDDAVPWTAATLEAFSSQHPGRQLVLGETGWPTELNPEGREAEHIRAPAGEAEQAAFYAAFAPWAEGAGVPYFWFEAFDEPWKGSDDPREVEKHWGLFDVQRRPKAALAEVGP